MSDGFVPLAVFLAPPPAEAVQSSLPDPSPPEDSPAPRPYAPEALTEYASALGDVRRFRAALADALDVAVQQLLAQIAENVLARELALGPADVGAIAARARERITKEKILAVRIHPRDRDALDDFEIDAVLDQTLAPGDIVVELRSGTIDLRLQARLDMALAACVP
jgi:flagellar biosynthesis/type III secretory pathway protein FliH